MQQEIQREREGDERTGTDLPNADGNVSDDDIAAIDDDGSGRPTGQDHSLDNYADTMPDGGVGGIQDNSDTTTDVARIRD